MLGEKTETALIALSICVVSSVVLLGGMNLGAMRSNKTEEYVQEDKNLTASEDVLDRVINEFSEESLREEFAGVRILTWDEYYELSGISIKEEEKRGVYGTVNAENCSMEWAGLLALKEISFMEDIDMNGMYLMMVLSEGNSSQAVELWRGYLCNFLVDEEMDNSAKKEYYVQVNAYTGEVLRIEKRGTDKELRTLFENSNKLEVLGNEMDLDYTMVPIMSVAEHWGLDSAHYKEGMEYYRYGAEGYMPMREAGIIILKEIHNLFKEDMTGMKLVMSFNDGKWGGWLLNDFDLEDENYKSYSFRMDGRTGKLLWITGGKKSGVYSQKVTRTDEEIIENARSIIKKYHLANVEKLNWNTVTVYNAGKNLGELQLGTDGRTDARITDYIEFYSDEGELIRVATDWETGELWMLLNKDYVYMYE